MKKTVVISAIVAAAAWILALFFGFLLGGPSAVKATTPAMAGSTSATSATAATVSTGAPAVPDCSLTGRGHIYEGGFCAFCGTEEPTSYEYFDFKLNTGGTYTVSPKDKSLLPKRLIIPESYNGTAVTVVSGFSGTDVEYLHLPEGVMTLNAYAFSECERLRAVSLPATLHIVNGYAFVGCTSLLEVVLKGDMQRIGDFAFSSCTALESVVLHGAVEKMENCVFDDCRALANVSFAAPVKTMGKRVFAGCTALESIALPEGMTSAGDSLFEGCTSLLHVQLPQSLGALGAYPFAGCGKLRVTVDEKNNSFICHEKMLILKGVGEGGTLLWSGGATAIPQGEVSAIGSRAFEGNAHVTEVTVPEGVVSIGSSAFYACSMLESVSLPKSIKFINTWAFQECPRLASVYYGGTVAQWLEIGGETAIVGALTVYCADGTFEYGD